MSMTDPVEQRRKVLRLTVEIPDVYADDLPDTAALWADGRTPTARHYLDGVLEEWLREDATISVVTLPGEKSMNDEFEIHGYSCRIVGVSVRDRETDEVLPPPPTSTRCSQCGVQRGAYIVVIDDGEERALCGPCYRARPRPLTHFDFDPNETIEFTAPVQVSLTCAECGTDDEISSEDIIPVYGPPPGQYLCASCRPAPQPPPVEPPKPFAPTMNLLDEDQPETHGDRRRRVGSAVRRLREQAWHTTDVFRDTVVTGAGHQVVSELVESALGVDAAWQSYISPSHGDLPEEFR